MSTRVYIGRLARDARERDLERLFKSYGDIREINIKTGYGFVEFRDSRDAEDVVYDFHGKEFLGERIIVELARGTRRGRDGGGGRGHNDRKRSSYRLIVENIPSGTSWQDLKDMMRKAGEVTFADVIRSRPGEGVVEFAHSSDMKYALKSLNDSELNGARVSLYEDTGRRSSRRRSRSDSRSRSPRRRSSRRSRSRSLTPSRSRSRSRSPRRSSGGGRRSSRRRSDDEDADVRSPEPERSRERTPEKRAERSRSYSRSPSRSPARSQAR
ncbi:hypothetical protein BDB00DRAFT_806133 [Zychaea mexicana]|uniref:uncharacterized protein n=1 Tax=Zychaea mexicana TaxID=64656 RepID=UPI0022FE7BF2|nr:uncharacterized protein BDB00DRAFT_806133 [Zychaea mexicana]KAI9496948.1 hypothetical protein BDB00DRAFT_806133 [Zychaea mexicana]